MYIRTSLPTNAKILTLAVSLVALGCDDSSDERVAGGTSTGGGQTAGSTGPDTSVSAATAPETGVPETGTSGPMDSGTTGPGASTEPETTGGTEEETTSSSSDTGVDSRCEQISLKGELGTTSQPGIYRLDGLFGGDEALADRLQIEFWSDETGMIDLTANGNDTYQFCNQCLLVTEDGLDDEPESRQYFQTEGMLDIDDASPPSSGNVIVSLIGVTLVEVVVGPNFEIDPVEGGGCIEFADVTLAAPAAP